jgi:hypothetical protein
MMKTIRAIGPDGLALPEIQLGRLLLDPNDPEKCDINEQHVQPFMARTQPGKHLRTRTTLVWKSACKRRFGMLLRQARLRY